GSAVRRLVETDRREAGVAGAGPAGHGAHAPDGARDADVQGVVVGRIDDDRADGPAHGERAARHEAPAVAPIGRLVDAHTGLRVAGGIGLTGPDVDRPTGVIGRVDHDRPNGV